MEVSKINITRDDNNKFPHSANLECNTLSFGIINFNLIQGLDGWYLQYENYPIVRCASNSDLFKGLPIPFEVLLIPTTGLSENVEVENITDFYIGLKTK